MRCSNEDYRRITYSLISKYNTSPFIGGVFLLLRNLYRGWYQPNLAAHIYAYGENVSGSVSCEHLFCEHLFCEHLFCEHLSCEHLFCEHLFCEHLFCEHLFCEHLFCSFAFCDCIELSRTSRLHTIIHIHLKKKIEKI